PVALSALQAVLGFRQRRPLPTSALSKRTATQQRSLSPAAWPLLHVVDSFHVAYDCGTQLCGLCLSLEDFPSLLSLVCGAHTAAEESSKEPVSIPGHRAHTLREDFYWQQRSSKPVVGRDRIEVSTLRCGR